MRMLAHGVPPHEVACRCGVRPRTVAEWQRRLRDDPEQSCDKALGRPMRLKGEQETRLRELLLAGAVACGFTDERWTQPRLAELVGRQFGVTLSRVSLWRALHRLGLHIDRASGRAIATSQGEQKRASPSRSPVVAVDKQVPASLSPNNVTRHNTPRLAP
jgi:transposase